MLCAVAPRFLVVHVSASCLVRLFSLGSLSRRPGEVSAFRSGLATRNMSLANVDHSLATGLGSRRVHNAQTPIRDIPYTKSGTSPEKRDRSNPRRAYVYAPTQTTSRSHV